MNTGQIYHLISIICYILSGLAFAFTGYLFFRYKVLNIFNVLSGRKLKQDMERLSHLSGAASEEDDTGPTKKTEKQREKKKRPGKTETLDGLSSGKTPAKSDTEELYKTEATEELYKTEVTEELDETEDTEDLSRSGDTDELDIVVTGASDTDLL